MSIQINALEKNEKKIFMILSENFLHLFLNQLNEELTISSKIAGILFLKCLELREYGT